MALNRRSFCRSLAGAPLVAGAVAAVPKGPTNENRLPGDMNGWRKLLQEEVIHMAAIQVGHILPGELLSRDYLAYYWRELWCIVAEWNALGDGPPYVDLVDPNTRLALRYQLAARVEAGLFRSAPSRLFHQHC